MHRPHTHAVIISIGDELVLGQSLDTNSAWLSELLVSRGIRPIRHVTVEDEAGAIAAEIGRGAADSALVIVTGGLGPTADDLTRGAMARAMGVELVADAGALAVLEGWFAGRGMEMAEQNRVQALRPRGAVCLENPNGTAPGLYGEIGESGDAGGVGRADVFCLPGPPREMRPMFERFVLPMLRPGWLIETRLLRTFGLGESKVAAALGGLMERGRNPVVGTTAAAGVVTVRLRWEGEVEAQEGQAERGTEGGTEGGEMGRGTSWKPVPRATAALDDTERLVREALGPAVFTPKAGDGEQGLAAVVVGLLRERGECLAVVESCTGGLLGSMVTAIPGSSAVFCGGWITYTNAMKAGAVGVPESFFPEVQQGAPGAVSSEVAQAMALGGLQRGKLELEVGGCEGHRKDAAWKGPAPGRRGVDHALAVTGVAGPDGGTETKPVGTVWICLASADGSMDCRRFAFPGAGTSGRSAVRAWAAVTALGMLRLRLVGAEMGLAFEQERRAV